MGMTQNNNNDAAPGDYDCWLASDMAQIKTIEKGKNAGEVKAVVALFADVGGTVERVDVWLTLDPEATTSKGKHRIDFTVDAFAALGAVNALSEIGAAIEADPTCTQVKLSGVFDANGKAIHLATLHVSQSGEYTNYDLWAKRKPAPKGLGAQLAALGARKGGTTVPAVNPFASRPADDAGSFAYGANAPGRPAA